MDLIERYVQAVSRQLPEKRRADVELELRSAIMDALDARGSATDGDVEAVLRELGDPAAMAASYHPQGQYLIGPELYPAFRRVLSQALTAVGALAGLWFAVQLATGMAEPLSAGDELMDTIALAIKAGLGTTVGITLTFVMLQRSGEHVRSGKRAWEPRSLPVVDDADRVNRLEAGFSILVLAMVLTVVGAIGHEAASNIARVPVLLRPLVDGALLAALPWLIASLLVEAAMQADLLIEGRRRILARALHLVSDALAVVAFLIAGTAVTAQREALATAGMRDGGTVSIVLTLYGIALVIAVSAVVREVRYARRRRRNAHGSIPPVPATAC